MFCISQGVGRFCCHLVQLHWVSLREGWVVVDRDSCWVYQCRAVGSVCENVGVSLRFFLFYFGCGAGDVERWLLCWWCLFWWVGPYGALLVC